MWLLTLECLAWAWFLLASPLFATWPDRGLGLSKAAGLSLISVPAWVLAWAGAPALSRAAGWWLAALAVAAAAVAFAARFAARRTFPRTRSACWLLSQGVWLAAFAVFLLLRSASPAIEGGEKAMDFAFFNTAIRTATLPLDDPWLAGFHANYYYFGYVTWALIAKLAGAPAEIAYNLAAASLPAAVAGACASIGLALTRSTGWAGLSAVAVTGFGTLAAVPQIARVGSTFDIWSPTRVIAGTINEFPFFTFFWADLHPHLMAMPNFIVFVGLAIVALDDSATRAAKTSSIWLLGAASGIAAVSSIWDVVPLGMIFVAVLADRARRVGLARAGLDVTAAAAAALVIALPFAMSLHASGINVAVAAEHSALSSFLEVHGIWLLPAAMLTAVSAIARQHGLRDGTVAVGGAVVTLVITMSLTVAGLTALTILAWRLFSTARPRSLWLMVAVAASVLLMAEVVSIDDAYGPELARMNSVFKFHLHACLLLGVAWAMCAQTLLQYWHRGARRGLATILLATAAVLAAIYPIGAIAARLSASSDLTLDGTAYLEAAHPDDRALIGYLNREVEGTPVIGEATGNPYSYAARISANTGLPAIIGWANHEGLWRRDSASQREIAARVDAVRALYEGDADRAVQVIRTFAVRFVVVGAFERQTYPAGDFDKFAVIGRRVFDDRGSALYEMSQVGSR